LIGWSASFTWGSDRGWGLKSRVLIGMSLVVNLLGQKNREFHVQWVLSSVDSNEILL
jgi:hypothetical protein